MSVLNRVSIHNILSLKLVILSKVAFSSPYRDRYPHILSLNFKNVTITNNTSSRFFKKIPSCPFDDLTLVMVVFMTSNRKIGIDISKI